MQPKTIHMAANKKAYVEPSNEDIAVCAYHIWEREGRPDGKDVVHWVQARAQLIADRKQDAGLLGATRALRTSRKVKKAKRPVDATAALVGSESQAQDFRAAA